MGEEVRLGSIQRGQGRVSVRYRRETVEAIVVEVPPGGRMPEPMLAGGPSWHLVLEGHAVFRQADREWDLRADAAVFLTSPRPYAILNPDPDCLRVLSIVLRRVEGAETPDRPG